MEDKYYSVCVRCGRRFQHTKYGRRPSYCSGACRVAASRARAGTGPFYNSTVIDQAQHPTEFGEVPHAEPPPRRQTRPEDRLASAILGARSVSAELSALRSRVKPPLAWRCEQAAELVSRAADLFTGDTDG